MTEAGIGAAVPGNTAADVFHAQAKVLEPGAVLTIEPSAMYGDGRILVHEEDLVVTEDGPRLLSRRAVREMPGGAGLKRRSCSATIGRNAAVAVAGPASAA